MYSKLAYFDQASIIREGKIDYFDWLLAGREYEGIDFRLEGTGTRHGPGTPQPRSQGLSSFPPHGLGKKRDPGYSFAFVFTDKNLSNPKRKERLPAVSGKRVLASTE